MFIVVYNTTSTPLQVGERIVQPRDFDAVDENLAGELLLRGALVRPYPFDPTAPNTDPDAVVAYNEMLRLNGQPYEPVPVPQTLEQRVAALELESDTPGGVTDGSITETKHATGGVSTRALADDAVTGPKLADALTDPAVGVAGLRTLGTGPLQAAPGDDARFTDARPAQDHEHTVGQLSDASVFGQGFVKAVDAADARVQLELDGAGAAIVFGTTAGTAAEGNDARFLTPDQTTRIAESASASSVTQLADTASGAATSAATAAAAAAKAEEAARNAGNSGFFRVRYLDGAWEYTSLQQTYDAGAESTDTFFFLVPVTVPNPKPAPPPWAPADRIWARP